MSALPAGCVAECHACQHRSLSRAASAAQKVGYLERVLAAWCEVLAPLEHALPRWGYRERASLNARWDATHGWRFGLVRRVGREELFIPIPDCPVHAPRVNALTAALREHLPPQSEFPLAYLVSSGAQATLIVKAHAVETAWLTALAPRLAAIGLEGLWLHLHPSAGRRLFARAGWSLLWGVPRSRDARGAVHGPTAFAQAHPALHDRALERAARHLDVRPGDRVVDLCCGSGLSLARWDAAGARAAGVELSGEAVGCAALNAPAALVLRGTCGQRLPQLDAWLAADSAPLFAYLNPPRSGLEPEVLEWLAARAPQRVAYLSCSAGSLARDLQAFATFGHRVVTLVPYDFFPQTHHVEVLALLERGVR